MRPTSNPLFVSLLWSTLLCNAFALHVHRAHRHRHDRRLAASTTSVSPITSISSNAVIADITEVEQGLDSLPQDLLNFLEAISQNLQQEEALLASLLSNRPQSLSAATSVAAMNSLTTPETTSTPSMLFTTSPPTTPLAQPSLCMYGGAGPLVPCTDLSAAASSSAQPAASSAVTSQERATLFSYLSIVSPSSTGLSQVYPPTPAPTFANATVAPPRTITVVPQPVATPGTSNSSATFNTTVSTTLTYYPSPTSSSGYVFNTNRDTNVAAYYGQTPATTTGDLLALCESINVDLVILAFVTSFSPMSASFGPACVPNSDSSSGLTNCTALAPEIAGCQQLGKPVLVSLSGYIANVTLTSDGEAASTAQSLWDTFGAGNSSETFRPFGPDVMVDGFDLDNESKDPSSYAALAGALRSQFLNDTSKQYYLSAAPQCPRPDASIPVEAMALADFVFVQFYNNPSCNIDSDGFQDSFAAWSNDLAAVSNFTKLFIGVGSFAGAGSGYVISSGLETRVSLAREMNVKNFGGIMLWDGSEALANVDQYGNDYPLYAKDSLE